MSIRQKLLIILLVFSVTPLLVFIGVNQRVTHQLQKTVFDRNTVLLARIMGRDLQQTAQDFAKILSLEMRAIEIALKNLVRDAERALSENAAASSPIFFVEDFRNPLKAPDDLTPLSKIFNRQVNSIENRSIAVSLKHQAFLLPPGIDKRTVKKDLVCLSRLLGLHQALAHEFGEYIYWQHIAMANGIGTVYPGHGGNYRQGILGGESRFQFTKELGGLGWDRPHIDAATGQMVITVSSPFRRPDGTFAGVAGIDFSILKVLELDKPSSQWSRHTRFFLVSSQVKPQQETLGFQIFARQDQKQSIRWHASPNAARLVSSDHEQMKQFIGDFQVHRSNLITMPYEGERSIWTYAQVGNGLSLLLIAPEKTVDLKLKRTPKRIRRWQRLDTVVSAAAVIAILIVIAFWRSRALVNPILVMVKAVQQLAGGDFSTRMDLNTGDERDLVANAFNKMVPQLEDRMRMHRALGVAQEVQQNLLPDEKPDLLGFDIAGKSIYCDETGGDYFDFLPCGEENNDRLGIVVGDVTGHGIGAALLMATARAFIRSLSSQPENLAQRITQINRLLAADVRHTGNFMTLFYLEITAGSRTIRWVRAGNDPAIVFNSAAGTFEELAGPGLVLGVDEGYRYEQFEKNIIPQETIIFIGTDGIWETHNGEGKMFGKQRLCEILKNVAHESAREIQETVIKALADFRGDIAQEDDVTMVVIKRV